MTALLDVACYLALLPGLAGDEAAVTHDISASLLRPVDEASELRITGTLIRRGRSTAFLRAEAYEGDAVVAIGQITKTILAATHPAPS